MWALLSLTVQVTVVAQSANVLPDGEQTAQARHRLVDDR
jgi:hypothetical protein